MKRSLKLIATSITTLATWFSHLSLRGFVVISGVMLALSAPRNNVLSDIDNLVLRATSYLFETPLGSSGIAVIEVPKEEIAVWQSDIHASGKLAALLANILNSSESVVALLLQQPIDTGAGAADVLIEDLAKGKTNDNNSKKAKTLVDRKYILRDLLQNERVVLGTKQFIFVGQRPVLMKSTREDRIPKTLKSLFWPACNTCFSSLSGVQVARPSVEQHTVLMPRTPKFQLLYSGQHEDFYPGFMLGLLRVLEKVESDKDFLWRRGGELKLDELDLRASPNGTIIPLNSLGERMKPLVETIPLDEALARSAFPNLVFISSPANTDAALMAQTIYSMRNNKTLYSPWWVSPLIVVLILISTLYIGFIATRLSVKTATIISTTFFILLILMQLYLVRLHFAWVPLALPMAWLAAGHFLLTVWKMKKMRAKRLIDRADSICIAQAKQLIEKRELEDARKVVEHCSVKYSLLQTLYVISDAYTERKDYDKAIEVLKALRKKRKGFKDTEQKLLVLNTMKKSAAESKKDDVLQQTMIIDSDDSQLRSLGRYRLEHEIGRGAMGQVFMGFDPRISRRLAIKTMSYDNFPRKKPR